MRNGLHAVFGISASDAPTADMEYLNAEYTNSSISAVVQLEVTAAITEQHQHIPEVGKEGQRAC